jgi:hypothetical protein
MPDNLRSNPAHARTAALLTGAAVQTFQRMTCVAFATGSNTAA